jgi:hypothetical protein
MRQLATLQRHMCAIRSDVVVLACAIATALVLEIGEVAPQQRFFVERDPALSFPYRESQSVPLATLVLVAVVVPAVFVLIFVYSGCGARPPRCHGTDELALQSVRFARFIVLFALVVALVFTVLTTNVLKLYIGRLVPCVSL